jgi:hypothetical protein
MKKKLVQNSMLVIKGYATIIVKNDNEIIVAGNEIDMYKEMIIQNMKTVTDYIKQHNGEFITLEKFLKDLFPEQLI